MKNRSCRRVVQNKWKERQQENRRTGINQVCPSEKSARSARDESGGQLTTDIERCVDVRRRLTPGPEVDEAAASRRVVV